MAGAQDGGDFASQWLGSTNWLDAAGNNVTWDNAATPPLSAVFGANNGVYDSYAFDINFGAPVNVQDITFAPTGPFTNTDNSNYYALLGPGTLNLHGNIIKTSQALGPEIVAPTNLTAGQHTISMRDSGGDRPEFTFSGSVSGPGGIIVDNRAFVPATGGWAPEAWGTLFMRDQLSNQNTYTGVTDIKFGRVVIRTETGLGSTAGNTVIGEAGTLAFGGGGVPLGQVSNAEPLRITRNTYGGGEFGRFQGAVQNNDGNNTLSGPITLATTDGRFQVNADSLTVSGVVGQDTSTGVAASVLSKTGGGLLTLTNNNSYKGGTTLIGGTLAITNSGNIGGPETPINFDNGGLRILGNTLTSFGTHVVDYGAFSGAIDIASATNTFTINQGITGGHFEKYGPGLLKMAPASTNSLADRFRVNGGTLDTNNATIATGTADGNTPFIVGDNSTGTMTMAGGSIDSYDETWFGQAGGGVGVVTQTGGSITSRNWFVIGRAGGNGTYNLSGTAKAIKVGGGQVIVGDNATGRVTMKDNAAFEVRDGELWIGQGPAGNGTFIQEAGTVTVNNWVPVGRDRAAGRLDISGGTFTKSGGGDLEVDFAAGGDASVTVSNTGVLNVTGGRFRVGVAGGSNGIVTLKDVAATNPAAINSGVRTDIGTDGGKGTLNISSGTFTKSGGDHLRIGEGGGSVGVVNVSGTGNLAVNSGEIWVGNETGTGTLNITGGSASVNNWFAIGRNNATGVMNLSGGSFTKTGTGNHIVVGTGDNLVTARSFRPAARSRTPRPRRGSARTAPPRGTCRPAPRTLQNSRSAAPAAGPASYASAAGRT